MPHSFVDHSGPVWIFRLNDLRGKPQASVHTTSYVGELHQWINPDTLLGSLDYLFLSSPLSGHNVIL